MELTIMRFCLCHNYQFSSYYGTSESILTVSVRKSAVLVEIESGLTHTETTGSHSGCYQ